MTDANRSVVALAAIRVCLFRCGKDSREFVVFRSGVKMNRGCFRQFLILCFFSALAGCGEDTGGVRFATATGTVTYKGAPLAGASIMAIPDKGPVAVANTDDKGKFTLSTGTRSGVAIGNIRVSVSTAESGSNSVDVPAVGSDPSNVGANMQSMSKLVDAQKGQNKKPQSKSASALAKYADPATSGLVFEIKSSGSNDLKIELK